MTGEDRGQQLDIFGNLHEVIVPYKFAEREQLSLDQYAKDKKNLELLKEEQIE